MAVRIRKYRKRPTRRVRRVRRTMRSKRLTQGKIYSFRRTCQISPWYFDSTISLWTQYTSNVISNSTASASASGIFKFRLNDLPNPTDFTMLFEQFKITGVKLRFMPYQGTESSAASSLLMVPLATCIDRGANDQILTTPSFNSLMENQDVKIRNTQRGFNVWLGTPTFHQPADAASQVSYKSGWLDSDLQASRDVDHHGLKWSWAVPATAERSVSYLVYATYYIKCRNPQ